LVLFWLVGCQSVDSNGPLRAVDGRLDLTARLQDERGVVSLQGEWAFFSQQFVPPAQLEAASRLDAAEHIYAPGYWHNKSIDGSPVPRHGYATYALKLALPDNPPPLALKVIDAGTAYDLYVDGVLLHSAGSVGSSKETSAPGFHRALIVLPESERSERLLVLHVSNFHYRTGGVWEHILIGSVQDVLYRYDFALGYAILLASGIGVIGLYHLGLFSLRPQDPSPLYFALFCLAVVLRILSTDERFISQLLPALSFNSLIKIEYLSFLLAPPAFAAFLRRLVPTCFPLWIANLVIYVAAAFALLVLLSPPRVFSEWLFAFQGYLVAGCFAGLYVLARAVAQRRDVARGFLFGFVVLVLTVINDILVSRGFLHTPFFLVGAGQFCFIAIQSYALSLRSAQAFKAVERLRGELEAYSADLERKVDERTLKLEEANQELERLAVLDGLTQIANRRKFDETLEREWASHRRRRAPLSVILCDIDFFKRYNDSYGHLKGDDVLRQVAVTIQEILSRPADLVARYGGEEFVLLLPDTSAEGAAEVAEKVRHAISSLGITHGESHHGELSLSLGVASVIPSDDAVSKLLLKQADESLYRAKANGRNRVESSISPA
jgi:diguanylate cyclase (GGDEF)-like protein